MHHLGSLQIWAALRGRTTCTAHCTGLDSLSPSLRDSRVIVSDYCVQGLHPIFGPPTFGINFSTLKKLLSNAGIKHFRAISTKESVDYYSTPI
jgi:hypothetical protein